MPIEEFGYVIYCEPLALLALAVPSKVALVLLGVAIDELARPGA